MVIVPSQGLKGAFIRGGKTRIKIQKSIVFLQTLKLKIPNQSRDRDYEYSKQKLPWVYLRKYETFIISRKDSIDSRSIDEKNAANVRTLAKFAAAMMRKLAEFDYLKFELENTPDFKLRQFIEEKNQSIFVQNIFHLNVSSN